MRSSSPCAVMLVIGLASACGDETSTRPALPPAEKSEIDAAERDQLLADALSLVVEVGYDPRCFTTEYRYYDPVGIPGISGSRWPRWCVFFRPSRASLPWLIFYARGQRTLAWPWEAQLWSPLQHQVVASAMTQWKADASECSQERADLLFDVAEDRASFYVSVTDVNAYLESSEDAPDGPCDHTYVIEKEGYGDPECSTPPTSDRQSDAAK